MAGNRKGSKIVKKTRNSMIKGKSNVELNELVELSNGEPSNGKQNKTSQKRKSVDATEVKPNKKGKINQSLVDKQETLNEGNSSKQKQKSDKKGDS